MSESGFGRQFPLAKFWEGEKFLPEFRHRVTVHVIAR